jgi:uncharacterized protein YprB with RNaseH-like and TPR domain
MKIAHLDLECSNLNADWGVIICGCIKWDNGKLDTFRITDYKQKDIMDDSGVCIALSEALNDADMWVSWYGARFDVPFLQARLLYHRKKPMSTHIAHVDLWRTSRYQLKLSSNRLANIERFLNLSASKTPIDQGAWIKAIAGSKKHMNTVVKHCKEDVKMLEEAYHLLRPLTKGHPLITNEKGEASCPKCGSHKVVKRGTRRTKTRVYQTWQCKDCGSWSSSRTADKLVPQALVA